MHFSIKKCERFFIKKINKRQTSWCVPKKVTTTVREILRTFARKENLLVRLTQTLYLCTSKLCTQKAEGTLSLFICEHTALSIVDHLSEMCKRTFSDSRSTENMRLHRTKCTNIINDISGPHFVSELTKDIGNSKFSILHDESTDISVTKVLGISIRYYSKTEKIINTTFLGLVEIENGTAIAIVNGDPINTIKVKYKKSNRYWNRQCFFYDWH